MSVCLCVCRVPPPWNLPFWYPPSSPSPEDFFRYPPQLHPRPSAADMPRSLALFSCSNPRLPFDLSPFPLKLNTYLIVNANFLGTYLIDFNCNYWDPYFISGWWFGTSSIFPHIGNNHPNWRTPSFFRGVGQPPTRLVFPIINHIIAIIINHY